MAEMRKPTLIGMMRSALSWLTNREISGIQEHNEIVVLSDESVGFSNYFAHIILLARNPPTM